MLRKGFSILLVLTLVVSLFTACGNGGSQPAETTKKAEETTAKKAEETTKKAEEAAKPAEVVKVGMVTDSGTIDDKSFNQGTWEGIKAYEAAKGTIAAQYQQPEGESATDYINAISDLVDNGFEIIVTPGFKFETAIFEAQDLYSEASFILIDGTPHSEDYSEFRAESNVVSIFFNEHEAGFLAGVAAAQATKTGKMGFVGGMEIPPVQKFGWGFKAGVKYANDNFGTSAEVTDYIYEGTFSNVAGGQQLASGMYDKGVDIIFAAAGGVGVGVLNETKGRASKGEEVFMVGVDVDQYADGIYDEAAGTSCILTSAMKKIDVAAFDYIDAKLNGSFPGGETITMSLADSAVGLPEENPNLTDDILANVEKAKEAILAGDVTPPSSAEGINEFLGEEFAAVQ